MQVCVLGPRDIIESLTPPDEEGNRTYTMSGVAVGTAVLYSMSIADFEACFAGWLNHYR